MTGRGLLLDSPSLVFRAYFALPTGIRAPDGRPVNAVRGYLDMTARLVADRRPSGTVHAFDADWRPAFRVAAYDGYKAHRPPDPPDIGHQFEIVLEVLDAAGLPVALADGFEADDVIGTLAARATPEHPVDIVTGDRDLIQVVRDPEVRVLFTLRGVKDLAVLDAAAVAERYGVAPEHYAELAMLRGDPSDGLPGVRGVGERTAARLLAEHGSLDALLAGTDALPPRLRDALDGARDYLEAMRTVVPVATDVPLRITPARPPDVERLTDMGERYGIASPVSRLVAALRL